MKKVLSVVLASAMVLSLAACGGQQTAATTAAATEAATEAAATAGTDAATEAAKEETTAAEATADLKGKMMGVVTPAADHGFTAESIQHCEAEVKALITSS